MSPLKQLRCTAQRALLLALTLGMSVTAAGAQDLNVIIPVPEVEERLRDHRFDILQWSGSRMPGDRTQRALVMFEDSLTLWLKFAMAPQGGTGTFNNEPRYEAAAYVLQRMFLDDAEIVVPPVVLRAFPIDFIRTRIPGAQPTFRNAPGSVLMAVAYWLQSVRPEGFWNEERARADSVYARHIGNFNILTHAIKHMDANAGNYLISSIEDSPRVFAVDNGVAFNSQPSNRGVEWSNLRVERVPRQTVERLRALTLPVLEARLGVLAEFEIRDGLLVPVPPGVNIGETRGVRQRDGRVQIGLTRFEIQQVEKRIRDIVKRADEGKLRVF